MLPADPDVSTYKRSRIQYVWKCVHQHEKNLKKENLCTTLDSLQNISLCLMSNQQHKLVKEDFKQLVVKYHTCSLSCKRHTDVTQVSKKEAAAGFLYCLFDTLKSS